MGLIRIFLALSVVIHHLPQRSFAWLNAPVAVELFFVISGFYMAMIISEKFSPLPNWKERFYFSRLSRLFPAYFAVLAFMVGWFIYWGGPSVLTSNFGFGFPRQFLATFLNVFIVGQDAFQAVSETLSRGAQNPISAGATGMLGDAFFKPEYMIIGQAWSLSSELLFYLLAPYLVLRPRRLLVILGASLLVRLLVLAHPAAYPQIVWTYWFFPATVCFFCLGSLAYHLHRQLLSFRWVGPAGYVLLALAVAAFLYRGIGAPEQILPNKPHYDTWAHWIAYMVFTLAIPFIFRATQRSRLDRLIGEHSYPVYIVHGFIVGIFFNSGVPRGNGMAEFIVILASLGIASLIYLFVDEPVDRRRAGILHGDIGVLRRRFVGIVIVLLAVVLAFSVYICGKEADRGIPKMVLVIGEYNIIQLGAGFHAVPQGVVIDWQHDDLQAIPRSYHGASLNEVKSRLPGNGERARGTPHLLRAVSNYNIVGLGPDFYAVPQGVSIDWQRDDLEAIPRSYHGKTAEEVEARVMEALRQERGTPHLLQSVGKYNIVSLGLDFYAVPQGVSIDWQHDDLQAIPRSYHASSLEKVLSWAKHR